jgi:hypothetical protein
VAWAAIESRLGALFLPGYLQESSYEMERLGIPAEWRPQGWWATMDPEMLPLPAPKLPITPKLQARWPFVQLRYRSPVSTAVVLPPPLPEEEEYPAPPRAGGSPAPHTGTVAGATSAAPASESLARRPGTVAGATSNTRRPGLKRRLGDWVRERGLRAMLSPYRPYEFYAPGPIRQDMVEAVRGAGLRYMFSKAGFGAPPTVLYHDANFLALNYTVGQWDGWTPFETINSVDDLRRAEKKLLRARRPGWLVGQLDTCLWAFTGPIWERGAGLRAIADFVARGGNSGRLINVTPRVVARYARLLVEAGL